MSARPEARVSRCRILRVVARVAVIAAALGARTAAAGVESYLDALDALAAADYPTRQHATELLITDPDLSLDTICELYARARVPEQRHRLIRVAAHRLIGQVRREQFPDHERGAVGIAHRAFVGDQLPEVDRPGVAVLQTYPGFPAYGRLRPGDLIIAVDGQPFPPSLNANELGRQFIELIRGHQAGDTVDFLVARQDADHEIEVHLQLASLDALTQMYQPSSERLNPPYLDRWLELVKKLQALGPPRPRLVVQPEPNQAVRRPVAEPRLGSVGAPAVILTKHP